MRGSPPQPRLDADLWPERRLVPYEATELVAERALVLAPHPDDEVFGCGGAIAALNARGAVVRVILVTDGAALETLAEERARIREARTAESRAALAFLGSGEVRNGGFADRALAGSKTSLALSVARWAEELGPDLVLAPSPVEVHPDHRALAEALVLAARSSAAVRAARVAFYEVSQPIRPNLLVDVTPFAGAKARAMAAFPSQSAGRDYPAFIEGLNRYRRMTLPKEVEAAEAFFVVPGRALATLDVSVLRSLMGPSRKEPAEGSFDPPDFWAFVRALALAVRR